MASEKQYLTIGLLHQSLPWASLLDQIGVHWKVIDSYTPIAVADFSVVISNRPLSENEKFALTDYAASGGAVLYTTAAGNIVPNRSVSKRYVRSLPPAAANDHRYSEILDLFSQTYFFNNGTFLLSEALGAGFISYCGIDIDRMFAAASPVRKGFYAKRKRLPHEIVAKRTRGPLRQIIQSHLEFLHHQRRLPFVHKWFYPSERQTVFTFRIDSDKGTQSQIEEIYQLSERFDVPTTWFLDVKSHEQWLDYFSQFTRQEIGVHCYDHTVFNNEAMNRENFEKALRLLNNHHLHPVGIAAPTGAWNDAIGSAIRHLGFSYSSEFAYDYDNLPSFPLIGNGSSPVVQLPVHPTCIGTMRRERMTPEEMVQYYIGVIERKIELREPVCLYHHPAHGTNGVFEEVFRYINGKKILKLSYAEYAAWWKRRQDFSVRGLLDGDRITFDAQNVSDDTFIRISRNGRRESIVRVQSLSGIEQQQLQPNEHIAPQDLMRTREWSFRHFIQNALDWWIKTTE